MRHRFAFLLVCLTLPLLPGCSSIFEGVTRGLMAGRGQDKQTPEDTGVCLIRGAAHEGIASSLDRQAGGVGHATKVLIVHGIGRHIPGYSGRLQEMLTDALGLDVMQRDFKAFDILPPPAVRASNNLSDQPLGSLRVSRYTDRSGARELLFYELTWSGITDPIKEALVFDMASEHAQHRAALNRIAKEFVNSHIPDSLIYSGVNQRKILASVTQGICWMVAGEWDDLPNGGLQSCDILQGDKARYIRQDDMYIITHSLGSRITIDALQATAASGFQQKLLSKQHPLSRALQDKRITVYMLANQLPLLQLGFTPPEVTGAVDQYCRSPNEQRLLQQTRIVAFSDPNDLLSYAIPPRFANDYLDSRLCPEIVNVTINVAPVTTLPVFGTFANPLAAHNDYEADARVIGLIMHGVGAPGTAPVVARQCRWVETRD